MSKLNAARRYLAANDALQKANAEMFLAQQELSAAVGDEEACVIGNLVVVPRVAGFPTYSGMKSFEILNVAVATQPQGD